MQSTTKSAAVGKANRQCWDCLKRRLVCDFTLPHCKKCLKNGRQCSGYDEKKPLQWVETGHVLSRKRRKAPRAHVLNVTASGLCSTTTARIEFSDDVERAASSDNKNAVDDVPLNKSAYGCLIDVAPDTTSLGTVLELADRLTLKLIITEKRKDEAHRILNKARSPEQALKAIERLIYVLERENIPTYDLRTDASDAVQAVHYLNTRIYPQGEISKHLAPNPHNVYFPQAALHLLPRAIHHITVCISLSHFVNSLPEATDKAIAARNWEKIYQHRGHAIRELTECISTNRTRCSDTTIVSVMMFLSVELQSRSQTGWRTHALGMIQLLEMRGGLMALYRTMSYLRPTLVIFLFIIIFANCSTPAGSIILSNPSVDAFLSDIREMYHELFPYLLCPPSLYEEIIRINYLRHETSQALLNYEDLTDITIRAEQSLARIEAFDPRDWAQPGDHYDEWLAIGSLHKHSIAVYCISALASLTVLPFPAYSPATRARLSSHGDRLLHYVKIANTYESLKRHLTFPLLAAGVEGIHRSEREKRWIEQTLLGMGRLTGTSAPMKAASALRKYWERGEEGWEECFTQPYSLIMQ